MFAGVKRQIFPDLGLLVNEKETMSIFATHTNRINVKKTWKMLIVNDDVK